ncbi:MAG: hypothetical protein IPF79_04960 [Ignavibacteria bacterium]|nr:hypothetical protein [Ignavibacteria bacterium]
MKRLARRLAFDTNTDALIRVDGGIPMGILLGFLRSLGIEISGAYQVDGEEDEDGVSDLIQGGSYFLTVRAELAERVMAEIRQYGIDRNREIEYRQVKL